MSHARSFKVILLALPLVLSVFAAVAGCRGLRRQDAPPKKNTLGENLSNFGRSIRGGGSDSPVGVDARAREVEKNLGVP